MSGRPRNSRASSPDRVSNARPGDRLSQPCPGVARGRTPANRRRWSVWSGRLRLPQRLSLRAEPAATTTRSQRRRQPDHRLPRLGCRQQIRRVRRQLLDRVGKNCFRPLVYELPSAVRPLLAQCVLPADEDQREGRLLGDCRVDPKLAQRHRAHVRSRVHRPNLLDSLGDHGRLATSLVSAQRRSTPRRVVREAFAPVSTFASLGSFLATSAGPVDRPVARCAPGF